MDRIDPRTRTGLLVGVLAMFLAIDVAFLVSLVGLPFTPFALGQAIIDVLPGFISIPLIETLQYWAKGLLIVGVIAVFFLFGALAGAFFVSPRRSNVAVVGLVATPWVIAVALGQLFAGQRIDLATSVIDAGIGLAVNALGLGYLAPASLARETVPSPDRRRALMGGAAVAALFAIGALPLSRALASAGTQIGNVAQSARRLAQRANIPAADPALDALPGITPRITANEDHYTVDTTLVKPRVDLARWKLEITGNVERPYAITYDELLDMEAVEQVRTLECISNPVGGDLISTAVWTGVRMKDLLDRASVKANSYDVVLTSVDGYSDSFPVAKAMEPDTFVAYLMNGKTLPQDHGYPVRVLVPNIYGMKNVKWLQQVKVETFDFKGYWQEQGWDDVAIVNTNARIDVPDTRTVRWSGGEVPVAGIAFAGARGIKAVEVSFDQGKSWRAATLEAAPGPITWVRWVARWTPSGPGPQTVWARATDGRGDVQTPVQRQPFPNGSTGYHQISLNVVRV
ncbi:MAG TPA: molybdopterin-dependent oxidoreductase [Candidatus Limnocylindria bacterium]|nr:molybdopterin-dependent oxidoreductase [Candidatus Limnocylindria bacterium]